MKTFDAIMDIWMDNVNMLCLVQDQNEKVFRSFLDQGSLARAEGQKMVEQALDQSKKSIADFEKLVQESVQNSMQLLTSNK